MTLLLPPIQPTRTIHTPFRLLTNILPTILTLDLLLDNIVIRRPTIHGSNHPQAHRNGQKPHNLVDEAAVREHDGAIRERLLGCVVAVGDGGIVRGSALEGCEFGGEVAAEEGEERDYGQDDVGDKGVGAGGEGGGQSV